jgi:hypothetical protein
MAVDPELEASLVDALSYISGDADSVRAVRESIRVGIVGDDAELIDIFEREVGPEQAEVDLHLNGPGVVENATNAHQFSRFVSGLSEAVKETAKARAGRKSYRENLLIEGATPGSVRVVLRVATPTIPKSQTVDEATAASTVDSDALRTVASILRHASDPDLDTPLAAEIAELPIKARTALKRVANASQKGGWGVRGSIRQRRVGAAELELTIEGAMRLRLELEDAQEFRRPERRVGTIDGFRWSLGTLYFEPDDGPRFTAGVTEWRVAQAVTRLMNDPRQRVAAEFDVVESLLPGDSTRTRVLTEVTAIGAQVEIPVDGTPKALPPGGSVT